MKAELPAVSALPMDLLPSLINTLPKMNVGNGYSTDGSKMWVTSGILVFDTLLVVGVIGIVLPVFFISS